MGQTIRLPLTSKPMPTEIRPPVSHRRPRVGFVYPIWMHGGVEQHTRTLIDNTPGTEWAGLCAIGPHHVDQSKLLQMSARLPVGGREFLGQLLIKSDALIVWGFHEPQKWLNRYPGKIISVAHGSCQWTTSQLAISGPHASGCVAVSELARMSYPYEVRSKVEVIPNGIDLNRLAPSDTKQALRAKLGLSPDAIIVGHVGRMSEEKRPQAAAEAVRELGSRAVALYAGDGPAAEGIYCECKRIANGSTCWVRDPKHIGDIYGCLDVLVMTSPAEGGPMNVPEAWAAGVPVVSTPVGAIPFLETRHGQLTWQVPAGCSRRELTDACHAAITQGKAQTEITSRARQVVFQELNAARFGARWQAYIQRVLK